MSLDNNIWNAGMAAVNKERYGHIAQDMGFDQQQPPAIAQIPKPTNFRGIETSKDFLARYRTAEYTVDGVLQTGMTYALTGYTGHGKSSANQTKIQRRMASLNNQKLLGKRSLKDIITKQGLEVLEEQNDYS